MTSPCSCSEIYFIRHGETDWNAQGRVQGHTDIPLNTTGSAQASSLRELLADVPFSAAFSSDLSRARQTAELILHGRSLPIVASCALRERSAGTMEGQSMDKLDQGIRPFFLSDQALSKETYLKTAWHPELETMHAVLERVMDFLLPHLKPDQSNPILVVSHGGVLRSLLDHLSFRPRQRWIVANCGFIKIKIEQQALHLLDCHGVTCRHII
jgi:broad specificity phosphatase PhoE